MQALSNERKDFHTLAETYDDWYKTPKGSYLDQLEKEAVFKLAQPKAGENALDVGCGTGNYTYWLADFGLNVTGLDPSEEMIETAITKSCGSNRVKFISARAESLPFDNNKFDLVLAVATLEFVQDPICAIDEMFRVLKSNGRVVIGFFNKYSLWSLIHRLKGFFTNSIHNQARFYSLGEMMYWLRQYGEVEVEAVPLIQKHFQFFSVPSLNFLLKRLCGFLVTRARKLPSSFEGFQEVKLSERI